MGNRGISFGYGFLSQEASFDITFSMIDYDGSYSYGRAFLVGLLNTLLVSIIGIILFEEMLLPLHYYGCSLVFAGVYIARKIKTI